MSVAQMAISLFAVDRGYMDKVSLDKIGAFETALIAWVESNASDLVETLNTGAWNDETEAGLKAACDDFAEKGSY